MSFLGPGVRAQENIHGWTWGSGEPTSPPPQPDYCPPQTCPDPVPSPPVREPQPVPTTDDKPQGPPPTSTWDIFTNPPSVSSITPPPAGTSGPGPSPPVISSYDPANHLEPQYDPWQEAFDGNSPEEVLSTESSSDPGAEGATPTDYPDKTSTGPTGYEFQFETYRPQSRDEPILQVLYEWLDWGPLYYFNKGADYLPTKKFVINGLFELDKGNYGNAVKEFLVGLLALKWSPVGIGATAVDHAFQAMFGDSYATDFYNIMTDSPRRGWSESPQPPPSP